MAMNLPDDERMLPSCGGVGGGDGRGPSGSGLGLAKAQGSYFGVVFFFGFGVGDRIGLYMIKGLDTSWGCCWSS